MKRAEGGILPRRKNDEYQSQFQMKNTNNKLFKGKTVVSYPVQYRVILYPIILINLLVSYKLKNWHS